MSTSLRLSGIHLRVASLPRSLEFYVDRLGFVVADRTTDRASLAAAPGETGLLTLSEEPAAAPRPRDAAGLFHAALLLPDRLRLGAWLRQTANRGIEFDGLSDHGVSEAIYVSDPDGNGLEFYADRPPEVWPRANGELAMTTLALDWRGLMRAAPPTGSAPLAGARWGHLHLRVTDLERSTAYYRARLGLDLTQSSYPGARFLAADGYHHHLALNTWGQPRKPHPEGALGLVEAIFSRADSPADPLADEPDGIPVRLIAS